MVVLIQDREESRALQNAVMNVLIPLNVGGNCRLVGKFSFSKMNFSHGLIISSNFVISLEEIAKPIFLKSTKIV